MYREHIRVFCFVSGAMVLVLSGRGVEAGTVQNEPESSRDDYPFVDGLGLNSDTPVIDTGDLEEPDTESSIVDGVHKIPRQFELPDVDLDGETVEENYGEFPFRNGLHGIIEDSKKPISVFNYEPKEGNDGNFPLLNGLGGRSSTNKKPKVEDEEHSFADEIQRRPRLRRQSDAGEAAVGNVGEFIFRDGLRRKPEDGRKFSQEGEDTNNDGFPFVNGLRRNPSTLDNSKAKDFQTTNEEYPFVNGLRRLARLTSKSENADNLLEMESSPNLIDDLPLINRLRLCSSGKFIPFVDCLRLNQTKQIGQRRSNDEDFEQFPVLDGISKKSIHPVKKRSVGANAEGEGVLEGRRGISQAGSQSQSDVSSYEVLVALPTAPGMRPVGVTRAAYKHFTTTSFRPYVEYRSFGAEKPNQILLWKQVIVKPVPFSIWFDLTYPLDGSQTTCPISYIFVKSADLFFMYYDTVTISEGGIGHKNVTMRISSDNYDIYDYFVAIYAVCP